MVAHVGKAKRQISPDLDLLVDGKYLAKIAQLMPVKDSLLGLSSLGSTIDIDIIATHDQITTNALATARLMTVGGVLLRIITKEYLAAMKFLTGRDKDMHDLALLLGAIDLPDAEALPFKVRDILMHSAPNAVEDFDSWISAFNAGVRL